MLEERNRPFTEAERRLLRRRAALPEIGSVFWMRDERRTLARTLVVAVAFLTFGLVLHQKVAAIAATAVFGFAQLGGYRERRCIRQMQLQFRQRLAEELESGIAYSVVCQPKRIFEREVVEDEGAFWIFDGGQGRYLALCGQDFYATTRFPSAYFEVVLGARYRTVVGIRSRGLRMPSSTFVSGNSIAWDTFPAREVTLFEAPPNGELPAILHALREVPTA